MNVTLAVEPMHPGCAADFTFLTSLDDALAFLDSAANEQLKLVLDTYHLGHAPELVGRIGQIIDRIALVQLGDARQPPPPGEQNRCLLGDGVIPLREIVQALLAAGYDGFFNVELLGEEIESLDYGDLLQHAKAAWRNSCRRRVEHCPCQDIQGATAWTDGISPCWRRLDSWPPRPWCG